MKWKFFAYMICLVLILAWSCGHIESKKEAKESEKKIMQQENETVSLELEKAGRYFDINNPSNNTADWNVVISKPGYYKVWLSSATKDTLDLNYANSVRISFLDNHLEAKPVCDKIVRNTKDVQYPYFRADSYMGSVYVSQPGEYNIQVISEKVIAKATESQSISPADDTKLISIILSHGSR